MRALIQRAFGRLLERIVDGEIQLLKIRQVCELLRQWSCARDRISFRFFTRGLLGGWCKMAMVLWFHCTGLLVL